jgi:hypothetical protein
MNTRRHFLLSCSTLAATPGLLAIDEDRSLFIEGYAGEISYAPGEELQIHLSSSSPIASLTIARLGKERLVVHEVKSLEGILEHPVPVDASSHGCHWPVAFRFPIPADWKSGYYEVTMKVSDKGGVFTQRNTRSAGSTCFFVLRPAEPGKDSRILLQLATHTYNAYNNWGGSSFYAYHGRAGLQGHQVSYHRPPASQFGRWELPFVVWAETNGYKIDYATNLDLELHPEIVKPYRLLLSVGHDEYWSAPMRDTVEDYAAAGGNVAFFSGNTCCWQVRWVPETRSLLSWKQWFNQDEQYSPVSEHLPTLATLWSHRLVGRPENSITGVGFLHGGYHKSHDQLMDGSGAFTVHRPEHWVFEETNLTAGSEFGGKDSIVGYECDGCELDWREELPFSTGRDGTPENFTVLGTAPAKWAPGDCFWYEDWPGPDHAGHAVLGLYTTPGGGTVVTAGTTDWAHGLSGGDAAVSQITRNVLDRLGK